MPGYYSAKVSDWRILGSLPVVVKHYTLLQKAHPGPVGSIQSPIQWFGWGGVFFTGIKVPGP
jgi:hypothetical protein